jgi:hypothetical protein
MEWGGSNIRPEATGYGAVYFGLEILQDKGEEIKVRPLLLLLLLLLLLIANMSVFWPLPCWICCSWCGRQHVQVCGH